ncbi:MAG: hypothetical protein K6E78_05985 [Treponema sp.]|nr:hypothetical protein [Treponema sp.]
MNFKEICRLSNRYSSSKNEKTGPDFILPLTFQWGILNLNGAFSQINSPFLKSPANGCYTFSPFPQSLSASKASPSSNTKALAQFCSLDFSKKIEFNPSRLESGHTNRITSGRTSSLTNRQTREKTSRLTSSPANGQTSSLTSGQISELTRNLTSGQTSGLTSGQTKRIDNQLIEKELQKDVGKAKKSLNPASRIAPVLSWQASFFSDIEENYAFNSNFSIFAGQVKSGLSFSGFYYTISNQKASWFSQYQFFPPQRRFFMSSDLSFSSPFFNSKNTLNSYQKSAFLDKMPGLSFKSENEISFPKIAFTFKNITQKSISQKNGAQINVTQKSDTQENITQKSVIQKNEGYFYTDFFFGFFTSGESYFFTPKGKVISPERDFFISPQFNLLLPSYKTKTKISFFALLQEKAQNEYFVTSPAGWENSKAGTSEEGDDILLGESFGAENKENETKPEDSDDSEDPDNSEELLLQNGGGTSNSKNLKISFGCENKNAKFLFKFSFLAKNILLTEKEPLFLWEKAEISANSSTAQLFYPYFKGGLSFSGKKLWKEDEKSQLKYKASLSALPDRKKEICLSGSVDFKSQGENFELSAIRAGISWNHTFTNCKINLTGNLKIVF